MSCLMDKEGLKLRALGEMMENEEEVGYLSATVWCVV